VACALSDCGLAEAAALCGDHGESGEARTEGVRYGPSGLGVEDSNPPSGSPPRGLGHARPAVEHTEPDELEQRCDGGDLVKGFAGMVLASARKLAKTIPVNPRDPGFCAVKTRVKTVRSGA
jgi:hypothetical protein